MIALTKSETLPKSLDGPNSKGGRATADVIAAIEAGSDVEFLPRIYAAKDVKAQLLADHAEKCVFCEKSLKDIRSDVEHFRPKKGWQQSPGDEVNKPGYYWLAYEWSNLLLSCQVCNQDHKDTLFPIRNPKSRARSHRDDIAIEQPLVINPNVEDPRKSIRFRRHIAYAVRSAKKGRVTIDTLQLNRPKLSDERSEWLSVIEQLADAVLHNAANAVHIRHELHRYCQPTARYSSMTIDYLIVRGLYPPI